MWFPCLVIFASLAVAEEECLYALEIVQVQDGSGSFADHIESMRKTTKNLVDSLSTKFGEFRYGVSSFVDKPIPTRGLGFYGNYRSMGGPPDWCYRMEAPLSSDPAAIASGLKSLGDNMGSGGDYPENPLEGLLLAAYDKEVDWTPPEVTHAESGRPISRILILFTDDVPHLDGDAKNGILAWNWPREYSNYDHSTGGFGSRSWGETHYISYRDGRYPDREDYITMANLFRIVDKEGTLTTSEEQTMKKLIEKFGPYPWPEIIAHPGDGSAICDINEYPSHEQVGEALRKFKITPIILLARPTLVSHDTAKRCKQIGVPTENGKNDIMDCLVAHYTHDFEKMGVFGVVDTISSTNVLDQILQAVSKATEQTCIHKTTLPPSTTTEQTTTEETTTAEEDTTSVTTTTEDTTTEDTTTEDTTSTYEHTTPDKSDSTSNDETSGENSTNDDVSSSSIEVETSTNGHTTTNAYFTEPSQQPSTTSKKASAVPVIAGASGGVAAAGVVAGILYKKFGMSMFGGHGTPDASIVQQVDTPESPVERETMEEVTMDMFQ